MRIKSSVMLGILLSFMTLCAVRADSIVTSKSYVDAQDALKQNKITAAGDPNNVQGGSSIVTRTGIPGDVAEVWIAYDNEEMFGAYDGTSLHPTSVPLSSVVAENLFNLDVRITEVETNLAPVIDPLNTVFQTKIPAQSPGLVVTYNGVDANGQSQFGQLDVYQPNPDYPYNAGTDADKLATMGAVMASMASSGSQPALSGTNGAVVTYTNTPGVTGERLILSDMYIRDAYAADKLVTAKQMYETVRFIGYRPISVMECTDADATDDECLLWHISQRTVLAQPMDASMSYTIAPFIETNDYPHYEPFHPGEYPIYP